VRSRGSWPARLDGHRIGADRGIEGGDRADAGGAERLEYERLVRLESCEGGGLLPGGQHEHRQAMERRREIAQGGPHDGGRAVGVVDHDQRAPPRLARPGDRRQRRLRGTGAGRVEDRRVRAVRLACNLRGQTRLPIPYAPAMVTSAPAPAAARCQRARSPRSSRSRPISGDDADASSSCGSSAAAGSTSSEGSWRRIASCRRRSSGEGSTPISSTSVRLACRYASSASAWRPDRYRTSMRCPCNRSRNGFAASSASISPFRLRVTIAAPQSAASTLRSRQT
jgi:hypothetical protein